MLMINQENLEVSGNEKCIRKNAAVANGTPGSAGKIEPVYAIKISITPIKIIPQTPKTAVNVSILTSNLNKKADFIN